MRASVIGPEMNLASLDVRSVMAARGRPQLASGLRARGKVRESCEGAAQRER